MNPPHPSTPDWVIYTPDSPVRRPGPFLAAMLRDLAASRGLAWRLFVRDLSAMYRQSVLGYVWAFVPPILAALPWMILNRENILTVGDTPVPYPAFVLAGTLLWQTFIDALNAPLKQTTAARGMLARIQFPREALVLAGLAETAWNFLIRLLLLIPVLALADVPLAPSLLWAPLGIASLLLLGTAIGLVITPVGLLYTDIGRAIPIVATFGMLLTPVVYPPRPEGWVGWLATWNPVSPVLVTTRDWLTAQPPQLLAGFGWVTLAALAVFLAAWFAYRLAMPMIVERMGG
ncbi:MAG: ABC transporter permease [Verrucomicrobiae bacterium]|nr:ABC transporter permease [Verrucomicrobiae bacterium]